MNRFFLSVLIIYLLVLVGVSIMMIVVDTTNPNSVIHKYFFLAIFLAMIINIVIATSFFHIYRSFLSVGKFQLVFSLLILLAILFVVLNGLRSLNYNKVLVGHYDVYSLGLTIGIILSLFAVFLIFVIFRAKGTSLFTSADYNDADKNALAVTYRGYVEDLLLKEDVREGIKEYNENNSDKLQFPSEMDLLDKLKRRFAKLLKDRKYMNSYNDNNKNLVATMGVYTVKSSGYIFEKGKKLDDILPNYNELPDNLSKDKLPFAKLGDALVKSKSELKKFQLFVEAIKLIENHTSSIFYRQ